MLRTIICTGCCLLMLFVGRTAEAAASSSAESMAPSASDVIARLALLGDPHVSIDPKFHQYVENFAHIIADVNAANVDAVLVAGDLTQSGDANSERRFKELAAGFKAKCWYVAGNHDVGNKPLDDKPATVTEKRLAQFESTVCPVYYAEDILPGVHLVGITSSLFSSGTSREKPQWAFLKEQLTRNQSGITLLLTHYPPYAVKADEARGYFNMEPASRERLLSLIKAGSATTLILSAHVHRPLRHDWEGVTNIGAPAVSFGLPAGKQPVGWTLIVLHRDGHADASEQYPEIPGMPPQIVEARNTESATGSQTRPALPPPMR